MKKFDVELFNENDLKARKAAARYWRTLGRVTRHNPDKYGADLIIDKEFYCEVEVKKIWKEEFKYDTVQVPYRKLKFTKLEKPCEFMILNSDLTKAFLFDSFLLATSPVVEVPNKYIDKGEKFFQVPVKCATLVEIPNE